MRHLLAPIAIVLFVAACSSGGDDPFTDADPRCATTCAIHEPSVAGAGDVCSTASAELCLETCAVRIAGVDTLCASCLLENSYFDTGGGDGEGTDYCDSQTCTMTGRSGTCTYPYGNVTAHDACYRQVNPRREVACEADFRPVTECATVCNGGGGGGSGGA